MEVDEEAEKESDKEKEKEKEKEDTKPRILLSGMESSQRKQMTEIVERLEGSLTEEPGQATHLVMPRLSRTNNFLLCLPTIKFVLKVPLLYLNPVDFECIQPIASQVQWILDSETEGKWVSEEGLTLTEPEVETRFNFSLGRTLARGSRDKLFAGKTFYLTPSVKPSLQVLSQIITSSGGR